MRLSRRTRVVPAAAAVVALAAAACAACGSNNEQGGMVGSGLGKFYSQNVQWGSCAGFASSDTPLDHEDCARISVPIDYAHPDGQVAHIALARAKATGSKIGSLVFNPGGPGGSGLSMAAQPVGPDVSAHFDRIGFDPRGIGASTPNFTCLDAREYDAERQAPDWDDSQAGIARQEREHRDYAAKCAARTGNNLLEQAGTPQVAQDLDIIRAALGDKKLNYVGYSYGTRIGWTYAQKFPGNVRAMVLDGAVPPDIDPVQESLGQSAGFQKVFDAFAADCATKPDCPLGSNPAQASTVFRNLTVPLQSHDAPTRDGRGLSYEDAITGVQQALYTPQLWRALTVGLRELRAGSGDMLQQLADIYDGRNPDGTYNNETAAFNSVRCVDTPPITSQATTDELDTRTRQVAPFLDDGKGTGHAPLDQCVYWPVKPTSAPHKLDTAALQRQGLPKVVVVSTTDDPATPYQQGVDLANQLGASLITFKGNQHTATFSSSPGADCVNRAVSDYLINLTSPAPGLTCTPSSSAAPSTGSPGVSVDPGTDTAHAPDPRQQPAPASPAPASPTSVPA